MKREELYPAVELAVQQVKQIFEAFPALTEFGYQFKQSEEGDFLYLPDRVAIMNRWKKYQKTHPDLPDLDIVSSEGIATNIEFINCYLKHDGMQSNGKEFVHDTLAHIIPLLLHLMNPNYTQIKKKVVELITEILKKFETVRKCDPFAAQKFEYALGLLIDTASTASSLEDLYQGYVLHDWYFKQQINKQLIEKYVGTVKDEYEVAHLWHKIKGNNAKPSWPTVEEASESLKQWQSDGNIEEAKRRILDVITNKRYSLSLEGLKLTSLPPIVWQLKELHALKLGFNQLSSLPAEIGGMHNLNKLDCNNNKIEFLPDEIGRLVELIDLDLTNNIIDSVEVVVSLKNLVILKLHGNKLSSIPEEIVELPYLKHLILGKNPLPREILAKARTDYTFLS